MELLPTLLILVAFAAVGAAALGGGAALIVRTRRRLARSLAADGTVVDLVRAGRVVHPVVEFRLPGGEVVRFQGPVGTSPPVHRVGQAMAVRYDPARPREALLDQGLLLWGLPGALLILGAGFLACSACNALVFAAVYLAGP